MNLQRSWILLLCLAIGGWMFSSSHAQDSKKVFVHYMPWYASKPVSGQWGWHWTMGKFNPDKLLPDGTREIASHHYPMIGPYDSNDPDLLECHVLMMKLAGIDGVIIDWYGINNFRDYAKIHRNTRHLIKFVKKAELKFAICYEDQTVKNMVNGNEVLPEDAVRCGQKTLAWVDRHWLGDASYLKIRGRPALLVFGPLYFDKAQWAEILNGLANRPALYGLPHLVKKSGANGAFGWPPVHGGKEISRKSWIGYLNRLYARKDSRTPIAVAFPGFKDIYQQAGVGKSHGYIDPRQGQTLAETLELAWKSPSDVIQIATWNDFGEGTVVEPTREDGYQYLEQVQKRILSRPNNTASSNSADLRLPARLYRLRKKFKGDATTTSALERVAKHLFEGEYFEAKQELDRIENGSN